MGIRARRLLHFDARESSVIYRGGNRCFRAPERPPQTLTTGPIMMATRYSPRCRRPLPRPAATADLGDFFRAGYARRTRGASEDERGVSDPRGCRDRLAEHVAARKAGRSTNAMPCRIMLTRMPEE